MRVLPHPKMFSHLTKFRKRDYEDLEGEDRIDMDITDPAMRQYMGMEDDGSTTQSGAAAESHREPPEGRNYIVDCTLFQTEIQIE